MTLLRSTVIDNVDPYSYSTSYDSYVNYYSPNYIRGFTPSNTPIHSQQTPSPSHAPVDFPPVDSAPCAHVPPAPSKPSAPAPRKCGNCGTTESCKWRNTKSKDSVRCNTCFTYRQRNKQGGSVAVIQEDKRMKRMKSQCLNNFYFL